jgi:protein TonB
MRAEQRVTPAPTHRASPADRGLVAPGPATPFAEVCRRRAGGGRRAAFVAVSLLAQGALIAAVVHMQSPAARPADVQVLVPVVFKRPSLPAAPAPPGPPARPAPRPRRKVVRAPKPIVQPKAPPERLPPPDPTPPEPAEGDATEDEGTGEGEGVAGGVPGGAGDGVVGGVPGGGGPVAAEPMPARPADLAMVRERIARTLAYPPRAKRMGWEGRVALAFVLLADGTVRDLCVTQSSGYGLLDEAALAAVERATPFPPPGVTVRVRVPVSFQLR